MPGLAFDPRRPRLLPDLSRLVVLVSAIAAALTHGWLASARPGIAPAAAAAFLITFAIARVSLVAAIVPVLLAAYVAPAVMFVAFGVSDYHTTLIWLAALLGPIVSQADVTTWHIPGRWRLPFVAWALVIAVSWPIAAGRELDFTLVAARSAELTNAGFAGSPRLAAAWIVIVALAQLVGILWFDLLWARFSGLRLQRAERFVLVPLVASAVLSGLGGLYQRIVDIHWLNLEDWSDLDRAGGLMLDANTFGIAAAIWAPLAVALAWRLDRRPWIGAVIYAVLAASMWTAGSRTALLAFAIGSTGLLIALAQRRGLWQPRMAPIILLMGGALLVLAMAIAPRGGNSSSPLQRAFDRLPRLETGEISRFVDEMWSRFGYGTAAAEMTAEHPLTGVGIGGFHVVSADYIYRALGRRLASDNAQNWWRHQIAELGALGALPSLWISVMIVAVLWRGVPYVEPMGVTTIIRAALVGVGLASLLGVPTQLPVSWLAFVTLLFWLLALPSSGTVEPPPATAQRSRLAFALAALVAAGLAVSARGDLRVAARALRTQVPYSYGLSPPEGLSEYGELRWAATRAAELIPVANRYLQITMWALNPDVQNRPVTVTVSLDGRPVIERALTSHDPATFHLEMPENARWALLEIAVSREWQRDHAVQMATTWLRERPQ